MRGWLRRIDADLSRTIDEALVPHEPSADELATEQDIRSLDERTLHAFVAGDTASVNRWLDERLELRAPRPAPVPVIPGRPS